MKDRELLELAALAVGYKYSDIEFSGESGLQLLAPEPRNNWNPLIEDGDAFRLAVKLEIDLSFYTEREAKVYAQTKHVLGYDTENNPSYQAHEYHKELYEGSNPLNATRRAIVRAAAEIGKEIIK